MNAEQLAFDLTIPATARIHAQDVLEIVHRHNGRDQAVSMHEIAAVLEIPSREVQALVKFLVEECGKPIGTATSEPFGYYLITDLPELEANYRHFVRRGLSNLKHASAYRKAAILGPIVGQLEIEAGGESS